ncbi:MULTISPECIES: methyl-accepting chemotaxis protein [unclassified Roseovarius]|uniref:methyl-accepting chemotaxis protein n=1 Tax=unclassified Roseovarius TaxID=2614913 RepID=UPI00273D5C1F|nr:MULTISPECIES: HAMP domain-containing methyl-accepting chemotaxis protein [unclassified Roseovarius]
MTTTAPTTDTGPGRIPTALSALSIRSKLAVAVAIGFLLTFGVCFALLSKNLNSMSLEEQAADQADFAAMLSNQMRGPMQFKDGARLADIYATATESDESLIAVEILHGSGEQLAVYNARNAPPALLPQALKESLETKTVTQILSGEIDIVAVPVFAKDGVTVLGVAGFAWDNGIFLAAQNTKILQILGLSAVVAVAGLVAIFLAISHLVTGPIKALSNAMKAVANHDYTTEIPGARRGDEIGTMAQGLEGFRDTLLRDETEARERQERTAMRQKLLHHLGERMSLLASGQTDCMIKTADFDGLDTDHIEICDNYNDVVSNLRSMLSTIVSTAESVRTSSQEISEVAEDQSKRSEAQAATLEESAAAIEELNNSVQMTATLAVDANERIADNKKRAATGGAVVERTVKAMRDIEDSSQQITAIIGVIDDIAFQTNLLALNAGVEAARAGDSGRGFAVVASEVRALAQRASDSANEIKELITRSSEHVTEGSRLANQAGSALSDIIDGVNHVSDLVSRIATGSSEQATNLAEIKDSVTELDKVTQQNAAVIEESSAASRSLSHEARRMSEILRQFNLDELHDSGADTAPPLRAAQATTGWEAEIARAETRDAAPAQTGIAANATVPAASSVAVNGQEDWHDF